MKKLLHRMRGSLDRAGPHVIETIAMIMVLQAVAIVALVKLLPPVRW